MRVLLLGACVGVLVVAVVHAQDTAPPSDVPIVSVAGSRPMSLLSAGSHPFVAPVSGMLYLKCVGGGAGAESQFGIGTSPATFIPHLITVPQSCPTAEVAVMRVAAGQNVPLAMRTHWNGQVYWAFSNNDDQASVVAFGDWNNSLRLGGSIVRPVARNTWVLHLDDAAHYTIEPLQADNILVQVRIQADGESAGPALSPTPTIASAIDPARPVQLISRHSGKCLDAIAGPNDMQAAVQRTCNDAPTQLWLVTPAVDGHKIVSASNRNLCLNLRAATRFEGARIWLAACSSEGRLGELWTLTPALNGTHQFIATHSSKCLDVSQSSTADGAAILQYTCHNSLNQMWTMALPDSRVESPAAAAVRARRPRPIAHVAHDGVEFTIRLDDADASVLMVVVPQPDGRLSASRVRLRVVMTNGNIAEGPAPFVSSVIDGRPSMHYGFSLGRSMSEDAIQSVTIWIDNQQFTVFPF